MIVFCVLYTSAKHFKLAFQITSYFDMQWQITQKLLNVFITGIAFAVYRPFIMLSMNMAHNHKHRPSKVS